MKNISKRRQELGLSVLDLHALTKIPAYRLRMFEHEEAEPTAAQARRIAKALKAELGDFTDSCELCDGTGYVYCRALVF